VQVAGFGACGGDSCGSIKLKTLDDELGVSLSMDQDMARLTGGENIQIMQHHVQCDEFESLRMLHDTRVAQSIAATRSGPARQ